MENTILNKEKFVTQHWGQKVGCSRYSKNFTINKSNIGSVEYLQLKSLQSISDGDCVELFDLLIPNHVNDDKDVKIRNVKRWIESEEHFLKEAEIILSFLRSKGYLISYNGLTPDQIIEYGWAKI